MYAHIDTKLCVPRCDFTQLQASLSSITLIAVGVGLAPMIQIIRYFLASSGEDEVCAINL